MFNRCLECFLIGYLWCTLVHFHFKFSSHPVYNNFKMQFTHPTQDRLTSFFICFNTKRWIFFYQLTNSHSHFINVSLCLWFHSYGNNGLRNEHVFQNYWMIFITKSISCFYFFKSNRSSNITRFNKINWILFIRKHLHDPADPFFLSASDIQYIRASIQVPGITTKESQASHKWIGHDLESKRSKGFLRVRLS